MASCLAEISIGIAFRSNVNAVQARFIQLTRLMASNTVAHVRHID